MSKNFTRRYLLVFVTVQVLKLSSALSRIFTQIVSNKNIFVQHCCRLYFIFWLFGANYTVSLTYGGFKLFSAIKSNEKQRVTFEVKIITIIIHFNSGNKAHYVTVMNYFFLITCKCNCDRSLSKCK